MYGNIYYPVSCYLFSAFFVNLLFMLQNGTNFKRFILIKLANYLASFGHQFVDGLSAISNGVKADKFNAINGNLKLGYHFSEALKVNVYGSFDKHKADFDDGFSFSDADNLLTTDQYRISISPEYNYKKGSITINGAYNKIEREIEYNGSILLHK